MNFVMNRGMGFVNGSSFQNLTIASVTLKVSNVSSYYFLTSSSINLTDYLNCYATLTDTGGKAKKVQLGAAGTGETLGADVFGGTGAFTDPTGWTVGPGWEITGGRAVATNVAGTVVYRAHGLVPGALIYATFDVDRAGGYLGYYANGSGSLTVAKNVSGSYASYQTLGVGTTYAGAAASGPGCTGAVDNLIIKPVLTPDTTGCWFTPISEDSGWLPNSATYTLLLTRS